MRIYHGFNTDISGITYFTSERITQARGSPKQGDHQNTKTRPHHNNWGSQVRRLGGVGALETGLQTQTPSYKIYDQPHPPHVLALTLLTVSESECGVCGVTPRNFAGFVKCMRG